MGQAAVAADGASRLNVFVRGSGDGQIYWIGQNPNAPNFWDPWQQLGDAPAADEPVVGLNPGRRLEIFRIAPDGSLQHMWQDATGAWIPQWDSLGSPSGTTLQGGLAVAANPSSGVARDQGGRLEVFAADAGGALWHRWQDVAGQGPWSDWQSEGSPPGAPIRGRIAVGVSADGRLEVFTVGGIGELWHIFQTGSAGGPFGNWESMSRPGGRLRSDAGVGTDAGGALEVFAVGPDGTLQHRWEQPGWRPWAGLGRPRNGRFGGLFGRVNLAGTPAAASNADERVEVFARGDDNRLWHHWMDSSFNWSTPWQSFGGLVVRDDPTVVLTDGGTLEVFVLDGSAVFHIWQTQPNNGWGTWQTLGDPSPPPSPSPSPPPAPPSSGVIDLTLTQSYDDSGTFPVPIVNQCEATVEQSQLRLPDNARITTVQSDIVSLQDVPVDPPFGATVWHTDPVSNVYRSAMFAVGQVRTEFAGQRPWGTWTAQTENAQDRGTGGTIHVSWDLE